MFAESIHARGWRRCAIAVAAAAGLSLATTSALSADAAPAGWRSDHQSHYLYYPNPKDNGGTGAYSRLLNTRGYVGYNVEFRPYDELLILTDNHTDGRRAQAEVKVYRKADADGIPYDLIDRDINLFTGTQRTFQLGTPDGTGDIPEGYYVAIRVRPEGTTAWSNWAYARA